MSDFALFGGRTSSAQDGVDRYGASFGALNSSLSEVAVNTVIPKTGIINNLAVVLSAAVTGGTWEMTLRVNGVDTALKVTIGIGGTTGQDPSHPIDVHLGDVINWKVNNSASNSNNPFANWGATIEF